MSGQVQAPCWYCGSYTGQKIGSVAHFCSWDCARMWDNGRSRNTDADGGESRFNGGEPDR